MTTYSTSLKLTLPGDGQQAGTWGQTTNNNLGTLLEQAITGFVAIDMADANVTLTSLNGTTDQARNAVIELTGTNSAVRDVIPPVVEKLYTIFNNTSGGYAIRVIGATGTGVNIPSGTTCLVYCNGTNFVGGLSGATGSFKAAGGISGTTGTFSDAVSGTTGTFSAGVSGTTGSFSGAVSGTTGTFSGNVTGTGIIGTSAAINGSITAQGIVSALSPNSGSTGGIQIRDAAGNPNAVYLQALNNAGNTEYASLKLNANNTITPSGNIVGNITGNITGNSGTVTNGVYTTNFTGSNQSITTNGYQKLPGGLTIQWGIAYGIGPDETVTVNLPVAFQSIFVYANIAVQDVYGGNEEAVIPFITITNGSNFNVKNTDNDTGIGTYRWIAVGF